MQLSGLWPSSPSLAVVAWARPQSPQCHPLIIISMFSALLCMCLYTSLLSFFVFIYHPFLVSLSTTYEMARVLRPSASLGLKPLAKKELLSSSPRAAISSALVPPYATTSLSTPMSQIPPHYLPISPTTDAGST